MTGVRTGCTYDCPDACGLLAEVEGGRLRLRGDPDHPITRGLLCARIHRHPGRLTSPDRLLRPLLRTSRGLREVGWDEALAVAGDHLTATLRDHGPAAVAYLRGGGSLGVSKELVDRVVAALGPVTTVLGDPCGACGEAAQRLDLGDCQGHDYTDLRNAAAVVLWGKNPAVTGRHLVPFVKDARARGAPVWLVEPRRTESRSLADREVRVAPGGDAWLALGALRWLRSHGRLDPVALARVANADAVGRLLGELPPVETCAARAGAAPGDVVDLAELYATRAPVSTWIGWGLQRRRLGGFAVRCIDALCLLTGHLGVPGGGASFTTWRRRGLTPPGPDLRSARTVRVASLAADLAALRAPSVRFLLSVAANPVTALADSRALRAALGRVGLVVVLDAFLTDTAAAADLVLPCRLMLEEDDGVGSYQHAHVTRVRRVVEPPDGPRSDLDIVTALLARAGVASDAALADPAAALNAATAAWRLGPDADHTWNPAQPGVPWADRFATPDGRATLIASLPEAVPADPDYPLSLLTPAAMGWQTSQVPEAEQTGPLDAWVSAATAARSGLADGAPGRVESRIGALDVRVRIGDLAPDLVVIHRGGWLRHGRCVNALVEGRSTDLGDGIAYYDQAVRLTER